MSPEEKLEMGRKMVAEAEAEIAAKKRNWPEKIEELMVFKRPDVTPKFDVGAGHLFVVCLRGAEKRLLSIDDGSVRSSDSLFGNSGEEGFEYLGRLRDLIPRKTDDAHEPTGAELVGKMCQFSDDGKTWTEPGECDEFDPSDREMAYHSAVELTLDGDDGRIWFEFARLAR